MKTVNVTEETWSRITIIKGRFLLPDMNSAVELALDEFEKNHKNDCRFEK